MPDDEVSLTRIERLMLSNQLRILEALYPDDADVFAVQREAIENGYEMLYSWGLTHILEGDETMSYDESREVWDTLQMYGDIRNAALDLNISDWILEQPNGRFQGYDGNEETKFMVFSSYTMERLKRFMYVDMPEAGYFNSHSPMRDTYNEMLTRWRNIPARERHMLSEVQIREILGVRETG